MIFSFIDDGLSLTVLALLFAVVGRVETRPTNSLFSSHEHLVEVAHAQLKPRRSPVAALAGAFGLFHPAQQRVHFGDAEDAVGAHGGMICRSLTSMFEQLADLFMQLVQVGVDGFPDDLQVNLEIAMRDAVAHSVDN